MCSVVVMIENLPEEFLEPMLDAMPIEISFVDADDKVRYYSKGDKRIFQRSSVVIGKRVQDCHPKESVSKVVEILSAFRAGTEDRARFWINFKGMKVLIQYFAVRDEHGKYLGCLEATQDITSIRELDGEKKLFGSR